jgi:NAD kinase
MRIGIYGKTPESTAQLRKEIERQGFRFTKKKPDIIITYGGDGTFLWAEREAPGIPKALFRFSKICKQCHNLPIEHALGLLKKGKYHIEEHHKLEARAKGKRLLAVNDIVLRNAIPTHAVRFTIWVDDRQIDDELIGDGVVVATPYGGSGYFHSITRKIFAKGFRIAFNNLTTEHSPMFLRKEVRIKITRGSAVLSADNNPTLISLRPGDEVVINPSKSVARIIRF